MATSVLISPGWFMPSSITATSGFSSELQQRQRQPDVIVQVPLVLHHPEPRGEELCDRVLRGGLSRTSRDGYDARLRWRGGPHVPGRCSAFVVSSTSMTAPCPFGRCPRHGRADDDATCAPAECFPDEVVPSNRSPRSATKKSPGCSTLVSMTRLPISPPGSPLLIWPRTASAVHSRVSRRSSPNPYLLASGLQRLSRNGNIVKRQRAAAESPGTSRVPFRRSGRGPPLLRL